MGEIRNSGWDVGVNSKPLQLRNFEWTVRGIYTKNRNTVDKLLPGLTKDILAGFNYIEAGMPYGYLRGSRSARSEDGQLLINLISGMPFLDLNEGL